MTVKKFWLAIGVIIVISVIFYLVLKNTKTKSAPEGVSAVIAIPQDQAVEPIMPGMGTNINDQYRAEVPINIKVPEVNEKLTEAQAKVVAVPTVVASAAPGATQQYRSFNIQASGGVFTPSSIIGNINDTIHINVSAIDKDYDIVFPSYNMNNTIKKGETKFLQFQAVQAGSFTFYCEMCGGENSTAKGSIIIKK